MNDQIRKNSILFVIAISVGIFLRFFVMTFGNNFDFDSYCIVGDLVCQGKNVYAETSRYNYGPIFFCIQGLLYKISQIKSLNQPYLYRALIVSALTMVDVGITLFVAHKYSMKKALLFFLNPISIIITGYHNQFDNMAVLLALLSINFYNEEEKFNKRDIGFVAMLSLCLITKHILFMLPLFLLLKKGLPIRKRIVYAFYPPVIFLLSFLPFVLGNDAAFFGMMDNVFLYRSFNNAPLLGWLYDAIGFPSKLRLIVYMLLMFATAVIVRKETYEKQIMVYIVAMVAFSSAIANQYLAIPMVALFVFDKNYFGYLYTVVMGLFLVFESAGLNALPKLQEVYPGGISNFATFIVVRGYMLAAWMLLLVLIYELFVKKAVLAKNKR